MSKHKYSQAEADKLIAMLKRKVNNDAIYLSADTKVNFVVVGDDLRYRFVIDIAVKGRDSTGFSIQGRKNDVVLLRYDINPSGIHKNPDNTYLVGSHIHRYDEEYETSFAVPYDNENLKCSDYCLRFFDEFNVVDYPEIHDTDNMTGTEKG